MITSRSTFILNYSNSNELTSINMIVRYNGDRIIYSTGGKILKTNRNKKESQSE